MRLCRLRISKSLKHERIILYHLPSKKQDDKYAKGKRFIHY